MKTFQAQVRGGREDTIPGRGRMHQPAGGNESERYEDSKFASCPPAGDADGCHTPLCTSRTDANEKIRRTVRIPRPKTLHGDGTSYLRCSPMTALIKIGGSGKTVDALQDTCSNTGIIDLDLLREHYDEKEYPIHPMINEIGGIGTKNTIGWLVLPITIDATLGGDDVSVIVDVEVHVIEKFRPGILLGLDFMCDYGITVDTRRMIASIEISHSESAEFRLRAPPGRALRTTVVRAAEGLTVPPRTSMAVKIKAELRENTDYTFAPRLTAPRSLPMSPQLPNALIDTRTKYMMFTNFSHHPMRIARNQALGDADPVLFGTQYRERGDLSIDWANLIRNRRDSEIDPTRDIEPPGSIRTHILECELADNPEISAINSFVAERPRPPRSIPEKSVAEISRMARKREIGDSFPAEDDEETMPAPPDSSQEERHGPQIGPDLNEEQRIELNSLLAEFSDCFSDGTTIGKVTVGSKAKINLTGPLPPPQPNRPMGPAKRKVLDEVIDQFLRWDVIEPSSSPTASPVVLVWQHHKWRFCVDFRALNSVTENDAYPMLRSDYVFSAMAGKKYFSLLDAVKGYHQVDIAEEDRFKTAFISHRGLYQFKRLPFGLRNAPAQFQRIMDQILGTLRWVAALVYIDDVLVYSDSWIEHIAHLRALLESTRRAKLKFSMSKCRLGFTELKLLGHGLSRYGLHTLEEKVQTIRELNPPSNQGALHRVIGMFGYYRNFIKNFAKAAKPLNDLKRTDQPYKQTTALEWTAEAAEAFEYMKDALSSAPVLAHPKFDGRPFILYTDASAEAFGAVLCQTWSRDDYDLEQGETDGGEMRTYVTTTTESWADEYTADPVFRQIYRKLQNGESVDDYTLNEDTTLHLHTIRGDRVCLPEKRLQEALRVSHDLLGHFGVEKTYARLTNTYHRPGLSSVVSAYVKHCPKCLLNKTARKKMPGSMGTIDTPSRIPKVFEAINFDLIVGLPKSGGYDAILTVIDRLTKCGMFFPTTSNFSAEAIAEIFMERIVSRGFLPSKFITDRDPRLVGALWRTLCSRLGIDHRKTAAYHAQTDGAAERLNQTLETALRAYIAPRQNDWHRHLGMIELAYNTSVSASTGFAPYDLLYSQPQDPVGRLMKYDIGPMAEDDLPAADALLEDVRIRIKDAQQAIAQSNATQKKFYDQRHSPQPSYKVGDFASIRLDRHPVSIITRNKLSQQKLPPYEILEVHSNGRAVRLDIPSSLKIHPVVSIQHLEPAPPPGEDPFKRGPPGSPATLESIVGHRQTKSGRMKYRVHRNGYDPSTDTWRAESQLSRGLIEDYRAAMTDQTACFLSTLGDGASEQRFVTVPPAPGKQVERVILYISRATKPYEVSYEATELELCCLTWAFTRLQHYLEGSRVIVVTDHEPIKGVLRSAPGTRYSLRIDKFRMLLMPFLDSMTILHKPGKTMKNVDPLSRATYGSRDSGTSLPSEGGAGREAG